MLAALAPEKGVDPQSGEDRRHKMPVVFCTNIYIVFIYKYKNEYYFRTPLSTSMSS